MEREKTIAWNSDTYSNALKALNYYSITDMNLEQQDVFRSLRSALIVFFIQMTMIFFVVYVMSDDSL